MTLIARRGFLAGLASMLAAPAIVHAGNLMPIKGEPLPPISVRTLFVDVDMTFPISGTSVTWIAEADDLPLCSTVQWDKAIRSLVEYRDGACIITKAKNEEFREWLRPVQSSHR